MDKNHLFYDEIITRFAKAKTEGLHASERMLAIADLSFLKVISMNGFPLYTWFDRAAKSMNMPPTLFLQTHWVDLFADAIKEIQKFYVECLYENSPSGKTWQISRILNPNCFTNMQFDFGGNRQFIVYCAAQASKSYDSSDPVWTSFIFKNIIGSPLVDEMISVAKLMRIKLQNQKVSTQKEKECINNSDDVDSLFKDAETL